MKSHFRAKRAVLAPAQIESDPVPFIRNERQQREFAPGQFKIPTAVRIGISFGIKAAAHKIFVRHADDIEIEIVERIAEMPFRDAVFVAGQIPRGRHRLVGILQPPDGIKLVVEMDSRLSRIRRDGGGVPADRVGASRLAFHRHGIPFPRAFLCKNRHSAGKPKRGHQQQPDQPRGNDARDFHAVDLATAGTPEARREEKWLLW